MFFRSKEKLIRKEESQEREKQEAKNILLETSITEF